MNEINLSILRSIEILIKTYIDNLIFDRTVRGKITSVIGGGKYTVEVQKTEYTISSCNDNTYVVNDTVYVCLPQGNLNDQFIIGKVR